MMFKVDYKKAYNQIRADEDSIERIIKKAYEKKDRNLVQKLRPVAALMIAVLVIILGVQIPVYAEVFVPENAVVSKDGVIMKVEKVRFQDRHLFVDVSFANEEGINYVNDETDYTWGNACVEINGVKAYNVKTDVIKYDAEEEKLYVCYSILRHTSKVYVGESMKISINGMYVSRNWREEFDLTINTNPATREVKLPVGSFESDVVKTESDTYPYIVSVLDETSLSEVQPDKASITGAAYLDGMLRIQVCYGASNNLTDDTKVVTLSNYDEEGKEIFPDANEIISWYERMDDKWVRFREYYYIVSEEKAKTFPMILEFYETAGLCDTVWETDFVIEK